MDPVEVLAVLVAFVLVGVAACRVAWAIGWNQCCDKYEPLYLDQQAKLEVAQDCAKDRLEMLLKAGWRVDELSEVLDGEL